MPRRTPDAVARSRARTVEAAVDLASVNGLDGLTIGRMAGELGMSKSGLIGRFGDKEELQSAVLGSAIERFVGAVYLPARAVPAGRSRLEAIVDNWIAHLRDGVFPGGCFVTTASVEFDARPGRLHDEVAAAVRRWLDVLEDEARAAGLDPAVAFELHSLASGGSVAARLLGEPERLEQTRLAMRRAIARRPDDPGASAPSRP